jgi:putative peptidoglycan lipid II flippase
MHPLQHRGPALAAAVSAWFNVAALAIVLYRRGYFVPDAGLLRRVPRMALASAAMVASLLLLQSLVFDGSVGVMRYVGLVVLVAGGGLAYGVAGELFGAFRLRELMGRLRRRRA